jgi:hypothetical protein
MPTTVDLVGQVFGSLTVVALSERRDREGRWWECRCRCGKQVFAVTRSLRSGNTRSCGCARKAGVLAAVMTHGATSRDGHMPEYHVWQVMNQRCHLPSSRGYALYGGRGITVCDRWRHDFAAFIADMGRRPGPGYSLDRIDNDGHYGPGNVRWATPKEQQRNRGNNRRLTVNGETLTLAEWSERTGLPRNTIAWRLRDGWSEEDAITKPATPQRGAQHASAKLSEADVRGIVEALRAGQLTQAEIARRAGVTPIVVSEIKRGKIWRSVTGIPRQS